MSESKRMVLVLSLIAIVSAGSLAIFDGYTQSKIAVNKLKALNQALKALLPDASELHPLNVILQKREYTIYKATRENKISGWGFVFSGAGFSDKIKLVVATDRFVSELRGIKILEQKETPGLGAEMEKKWFENQFSGLTVSDPDHPIGFVKNQKPPPGSNSIQALSAATISTRAVLDIINKNIQLIRRIDAIKREITDMGDSG